MNEALKLARETTKQKMIDAGKDMANNVVSNPAIVFVSLWLLLDWLSNHGKTTVDDSGKRVPVIDPTTNKNHAYLTPASAERLAVPLAAGFVAHSFGGGSSIGAGIANIIKAIK
jgi:hypothetical protein